MKIPSDTATTHMLTWIMEEKRNRKKERMETITDGSVWAEEPHQKFNEIQFTRISKVLPGQTKESTRGSGGQRHKRSWRERVWDAARPMYACRFISASAGSFTIPKESWFLLTMNDKIILFTIGIDSSSTYARGNLIHDYWEISTTQH